MRGKEAVRRLTYLEGVRIATLCDVRPQMVKCERPNIDLVYVCTQWNLHTPTIDTLLYNGYFPK